MTFLIVSLYRQELAYAGMEALSLIRVFVVIPYGRNTSARGPNIK
jgi:hypothetical protein